MKALVTGGAGCIGSELVGRLLNDGFDVIVLDNLKSGKTEHINGYKNKKNFTFLKADLLEKKKIEPAFRGIDVAFHLAANSDIKFEEGDPTDEDLRHNTIATYNVLEAMRVNGVKKIVFTSSSAVYGEAKKIPTPENYPLRPISLYGASKASCETMIEAFCNMFDMQAWILRFANITGSKSRKTGKTVLSDFIGRLRKNPSELLVLGDGKQSKSYLLNEECVDGMMTVFEKANDKVNIYNLGPEDAVSVTEIAQIVVDEMGLENVKFRYGGGDRGWTGDIPKFLLDITAIKKLGWKPKHKSREAIRKAVAGLLRN